jgi:hypothetical protein
MVCLRQYVNSLSTFAPASGKTDEGAAYEFVKKAKHSRATGFQHFGTQSFGSTHCSIDFCGIEKLGRVRMLRHRIYSHSLRSA